MNGGSPDEAKHPQAVPDYFGSLWANHKFGIGDLNDGLNGLTLGSGSRVVGPSYADGANLTKVDGFALVDLAMRYDLAMLSQNLKGATATLDVRNLLDKVYYSSRTDHVYCRYGSERRFLVGLRKTWGAAAPGGRSDGKHPCGGAATALPWLRPHRKRLQYRHGHA